MRTALRCLPACLLALSMRGQSTLASLEGMVTDPSGAVIRGVTLTLKNIDEGTALTRESGPDGLYQFLNVKAGRYELTAEHRGFSTVRTPEILFGARETRRVDFTLLIAPAIETIDVRATVTSNTIESGTVADYKNTEQIQRLPVNWRADYSVYSMLLTVPGVQLDGQLGVSIGGGLPGQVEYSVDGVSTADIRRFGPIQFSAPSPEILSEFRVTSAGAGAAYGSMGDVTLVSRSGTNQVHGSGIWYHQNSALDAKVYGFPSQQSKIYNDFGGSLGGPVYVPKFYDGRSRTFFFADYEGSRRPASSFGSFNTPTEAMREGLLDGVPGPSAVDPTTGAPFPGNRIPLTSINPVAKRLLDGYYPLPNNATPGAVFNYLRPQRSDSQSNGYDGRIDQVIGTRQRASLRWSHALGAGTFYSPGLNPPSEAYTSNRNLAFSYVISPRASLSNEFRFGFSFFNAVDSFPILGSEAVANLGLVGLDLKNAQGLGGFPKFNFPQGAIMSSIGHGRPSDSRSRTIQVSDNLNLVHGAHSVQFGVDLRRIGYRIPLNRGLGADDFGGFQFSDNVFTRNAFADFLLGLPAQSYYAVLGPNVDESSTSLAFFAQDHWRVNRRITIDLGLRWEVHPPMGEASRNIATFNQSTGDVIVPDQTIAASPGFLKTINACSVSPTPGSCTKVLTASQVGLPQTLRMTDYGDWGPRFGFAWLPSAGSKTVFRGAAGMYTQSLRGPVARGMIAVYSSDVRTVLNALGANGLPLFTLPNVLPSPDALGTLSSTADFSFGNDPTLRDPHSYQWNFTVERELQGNMSARASYIGVQSVGMPVLADFNQVPASTTPYSPALNPFPQWGRLLSAENLGFANYQGLQLETTRRFRDGFFFQASYTLAKNLGADSAAGLTSFLPPELGQFPLTDRFNTRYDRGELSGSHRHQFLLTGLFPLPFGKGRVFGRNWTALAEGLLGGWELSTVTLLQSGPFLTPTMNVGFDQSNTNLRGRGLSSGARPDRIGDGNVANPTRDMYFDKSAFVHPPVGIGRFGNAGAGILVGPGTIAISGGLSKTFRLSEVARLRLEATFTNLPNHVNFSAPSVNIDDPGFGKLVAPQSVENSGNRSGQLGARIDF